MYVSGTNLELRHLEDAHRAVPDDGLGLCHRLGRIFEGGGPRHSKRDPGHRKSQTPKQKQLIVILVILTFIATVLSTMPTLEEYSPTLAFNSMDFGAAVEAHEAFEQGGVGFLEAFPGRILAEGSFHHVAGLLWEAVF